jgi:hypothetical protein
MFILKSAAYIAMNVLKNKAKTEHRDISGSTAGGLQRFTWRRFCANLSIGTLPADPDESVVAIRV